MADQANMAENEAEKENNMERFSRGRCMNMLNPWLNDPVDADTLRDILHAIRKVSKGKRKKKLEKLECINEFFTYAVQNPEEATNGSLAKVFNLAVEIIIHFHQMLFTLMEEGQNVKALCVTFSANISSFLMSLKLASGSDAFMQSTEKLYTFYFKFVAQNPNSWFYALAAAGAMEIIVAAFDECSNGDKFSSLMNANMLHLANAISFCGDYQCQYSLSITVIVWLQHITEEVKRKFMSTCFVNLANPMKEVLFKNPVRYDPDYKSRYFLQFLNDHLSESRPTLVKTMACLGFFVEDEQIFTAEHENITEFWISFSKKSNRLHAFCSGAADDWYVINIDKEDVESVCFFWSKNNDSDSQCDNTQMSSFLSQVLPTTQKNTISELTFAAFIHIHLKKDFQDICRVPGIGIGKKSIFIAFNDPKITEQTLELLDMERHKFEPDLCKIPVGLKQHLNDKNLTFTQILDGKCQILHTIEDEEDSQEKQKEAFAKLLASQRTPTPTPRCIKDRNEVSCNHRLQTPNVPNSNDEAEMADVVTKFRRTPRPDDDEEIEDEEDSQEKQKEAFAKLLASQRTPTPTPRCIKDRNEVAHAVEVSCNHRLQTPNGLNSNDEAEMDDVVRKFRRTPRPDDDEEIDISGRKFRKTPKHDEINEDDAISGRKFRKTPRHEETDEDTAILPKKFRKTPILKISEGPSSSEFPSTDELFPATPPLVGRNIDSESSEELFPRTPTPELEAERAQPDEDIIPISFENFDSSEDRILNQLRFPSSPAPESATEETISFRKMFGTPRYQNRDYDNLSMCASNAMTPGSIRRRDDTIDEDSSDVSNIFPSSDQPLSDKPALLAQPESMEYIETGPLSEVVPNHPAFIYDSGAKVLMQTKSAVLTPKVASKRNENNTSIDLLSNDTNDISIYSDEDEPLTPKPFRKLSKQGGKNKEFTDKVYDKFSEPDTSNRKSFKGDKSKFVEKTIRVRRRSSTVQCPVPNPLYVVTQNQLPMVRKVLVPRVSGKTPCYMQPLPKSPVAKDPYDFSFRLEDEAPKSKQRRNSTRRSYTKKIDVSVNVKPYPSKRAATKKVGNKARPAASRKIAPLTPCKKPNTVLHSLSSSDQYKVPAGASQPNALLEDEASKSKQRRTSTPRSYTKKTGVSVNVKPHPSKQVATKQIEKKVRPVASRRTAALAKGVPVSPCKKPRSVLHSFSSTDEEHEVPGLSKPSDATSKQQTKKVANKGRSVGSRKTAALPKLVHVSPCKKPKRVFLDFSSSDEDEVPAAAPEPKVNRDLSESDIEVVDLADFVTRQPLTKRRPNPELCLKLAAIPNPKRAPIPSCKKPNTALHSFNSSDQDEVPAGASQPNALLEDEASKSKQRRTSTPRSYTKKMGVSVNVKPHLSKQAATKQVERKVRPVASRRTAALAKGVPVFPCKKPRSVLHSFSSTDEEHEVPGLSKPSDATSKQQTKKVANKGRSVGSRKTAALPELVPVLPCKKPKRVFLDFSSSDEDEVPAAAPEPNVNRDLSESDIEVVDLTDSVAPSPLSKRRPGPELSLKLAAIPKRAKGKKKKPFRDDLSSVWQELDSAGSDFEDSSPAASITESVQAKSNLPELARVEKSSTPFTTRRTERVFPDDLSSIWQGISSSDERDKVIVFPEDGTPARAGGRSRANFVQEWASRCFSSSAGSRTSAPAALRTSPRDDDEDTFDWDGLP